MTLLIQLSVVFLLAALQARMPALSWLGGLRIEFLPALVAWFSFTVSRRRAITLAIIAGFAQDALSAAPFGLTAVAYVIAAIVMTGLRDVLARELPPVQLVAGAFTSALAGFAACCVAGLSFGGLFKILVLALLTGALTSLLFFAIEFARLFRRIA
jgi:rod shape-determining protein MreD